MLIDIQRYALIQHLRFHPFEKGWIFNIHSVIRGLLIVKQT